MTSAFRPLLAQKGEKKTPRTLGEKALKANCLKVLTYSWSTSSQKIDVEIKRDGCTTGKKQKSPSEGEL